MTPQEDSKPGRTRREGNITYIRTEFATRVRFAVILLGKREARKAVIRQLKAEATGPADERFPKSTRWLTRTCGRTQRSF
jgi:hypothetical protein